MFLLFYLPNTLLTGSLVALGEDHLVLSFYIAKVIAPLLNAGQAFVTLYMVLWKDDIREVVANAWNDTCGKCCCRMKSEVPRRPSGRAGAVIYKGPWDDSIENNLSSTSRTQSSSDNYRTDPTLPKNSEWDEEDVYEA